MIPKIICLSGRLGKGKAALISPSDFFILKDIRWSLNKSGYAIGTKYLGNSQIQQLIMHRFIMNAPKGMDVDHINGNRLDNRRENLRIVTRSENANNRQGRPNINNKSGFLGVVLVNKKYGYWRGRISINGKRINLGIFKSAELANQACINARKVYYVA